MPATYLRDARTSAKGMGASRCTKHRRPEPADQLLRAKGLTDWERAPCCVYDELEIDKATLDAFRKDFLADEPTKYTTQELLYKAGALTKHHDGSTSFTNAGYLFFAADPQTRASTIVYPARKHRRNDAISLWSGRFSFGLLRSFLRHGLTHQG